MVSVSTLCRYAHVGGNGFAFRLARCCRHAGFDGVVLRGSRRPHDTRRYAAIILAFIGGLKQAAGVVDGDAISLVIGGIGLALVGGALALLAWCAPFAAATPVALGALALAFAAQGAAEGDVPGVASLDVYARLTPPARALLLSRERAPCMAVAFVTLGLAAAAVM